MANEVRFNIRLNIDGKDKMVVATTAMSNLRQVVKVTSTIIKNYGLEWSNAGEIQDKIQLTAKNGVTSFEQMAWALPRVTAQASTLGVTIDELMGIFYDRSKDVDSQVDSALSIFGDNSDSINNLFLFIWRGAPKIYTLFCGLYLSLRNKDVPII